MTKTVLGYLVFGLMLVCCVERTYGVVTLQDAKALWRHMVDGLLYVKPKDRKTFVNLCLKKSFCGPELFQKSNHTLFHWRRAGIRKEEQLRFWNIYQCVFRRNLHICPVDGGWSVWTGWTKCGAECGESGIKTRTRLCNNPVMKHSGRSCQGLKLVSKKCLGACDASHVDGMEEAQEYLNKIHKELPHLKVECMNHHCNYERVAEMLDIRRLNKYWSSMLCVKYHRACPVDGSWGDWAKWTSCSQICGFGQHERQRKCNNPASAHGGLVCDGQYFVSESCFGSDCKHPQFRHLLMSEWSDFSSCSITCGAYGEQESTKMCLKPGKCKDKANKVIEKLVIVKPCYQGPCPMRGGWSKWSQWAQCSADCGQGRRTQIRMCINPLPSGGLDCLGLSIKTGACTGARCQQSVQKGSNPEKPCTGSDCQQNEASDMVVEPASGDPFYEVLDLKLERTYTAWSPWMPCSQTCGGGYRSRQRNCLNITTSCKGEIRQDQFCDLRPCPVTGGWSDWLAWSPCGENCGDSNKVRYRRCDRPLAKHGGSCLGDDSEREKCNMGKCKGGMKKPLSWSEWSACSTSCGRGRRSRKSMTHQHRVVDDTCNEGPCPVNGAWSNWGPWSKCTLSCGLGMHFRDRACSDPAPMYGGNECVGTGTNVIHCYTGPCSDEDDKSITFNGKSWMTYKFFLKQTRFLLLYLRFMPRSAGGILLERHSGCTDSAPCLHDLVLSLENGYPTLIVKEGKSTLNIVSNYSCKVGSWHDLQVEVNSKGGYIRVDDGPHVPGKYDKLPENDIDFDADMTLGAFRNHTRGFVGVVSDLRQNFKPLNLIRSMDWVGPGSPSQQKAVTVATTASEVNHPEFRGRFFAKLNFEYLKILQIQATLQLHTINGLLFYNEGQIPGTFMAIFVEKGFFKFCLNCGMRTECQESIVMHVRQWYYLTLVVNGFESEMRVNRHPAIQITCIGKKYLPQGDLYLGKTEPPQWLIIKMVTGVTEGFSGIVDIVVVNGQRFSFKRAALLDSDGFMNSNGFTMAAHVDEIVEHADDVVYLNCDFSQFGGDHVFTHWFKSDRLLKSDSGTVIIPKLPGRHNESAVHLQPEKHKEGLYACAVSKNGHLVLLHAYSLWRHSVDLSMFVELDESYYGIVVTLVLLFFALIAAGIRVFMLRRKSFALAKESAARIALLKQERGTEGAPPDGAPLGETPPGGVPAGQAPPDGAPVEGAPAVGAAVKGKVDEQDDDLLADGIVIIDGVPVVIDGGEGGDDDDDDDNKDEETEEEDPVAQVERAIRMESAERIIQDNKEKVLDIIASITSLESKKDPPHRLASTITPTSSPRKVSVVSAAPSIGPPTGGPPPGPPGGGPPPGPPGVGPPPVPPGGGPPPP